MKTTLSDFQLDVLLLVCEGLQSKEIAARLGRTYKAVTSARAMISKKFSSPLLMNGVGLFIEAVNRGLVECPCQRHKQKAA